MSDPAARVHSGEAGGLGGLVRAALPSLPVLRGLPGVRKAPADGFTGLRLTRPPVTVQRAHVDAYAALCGFPVKDTVPLTYPHLLAFGLQLAMMTDPAFPAPAIGTVHLENSLSAHRPIRIGETLSVDAAVGAPQAHPRGTTYAFTTTVTASGSPEPVWESMSTYLRRGPGQEGASYGTTFVPVPTRGPQWSLPADLGRRYAAVSGDRNPIHLHPLSARALGFRRQIAHGMWTKARCVAALENRLPDAVRVQVGFRRPVLLPGRVSFGSRPLDGGGYAFWLGDPSGETTHLLGQATGL